MQQGKLDGTLETIKGPLEFTQEGHLKKGTIIKRDFGLGIGYPSIVKYLEAI